MAQTLRVVLKRIRPLANYKPSLLKNRKLYISVECSTAFQFYISVENNTKSYNVF